MNVIKTVSQLTNEANRAIRFAASNGYLFALSMKDEKSFLYNLQIGAVWAFAGRVNTDQRQAIVLADAMERPKKLPGAPVTDVDLIDSSELDHSKLKELFIALTEFDEGKFDDDFSDLIIWETVGSHA